MKGKFRKIILINVNVPPKDKNIEEKEQYFKQLENFGRVPAFDIKMVLGDFIAKLGRERIYQSVINKNSQSVKDPISTKMSKD